VHDLPVVADITSRFVVVVSRFAVAAAGWSAGAPATAPRMTASAPSAGSANLTTRARPGPAPLLKSPTAAA
jgi:hypothetical protein